MRLAAARGLWPSVTGVGAGATRAMHSAFRASQRVPGLGDTGLVRGLDLRARVGLEAWGRRLEQPVRVDVHVHTDVARAGREDHLPYSVHYGELTRAVERTARRGAAAPGAAAAEPAEPASFVDAAALADAIARACVLDCHAPVADVRVALPRALLHAEAAGVEIRRSPADYEAAAAPSEARGDRAAAPRSPSDTFFIHGLCVSAILGVNPWEREHPQRILLNLAWPNAARSPSARALGEAVAAFVAASDFQTVESLVTAVAKVAVDHGAPSIRVRVEKPSAIMYAQGAGVEIERERAFFYPRAGAEAAASAAAAGTAGTAAATPHMAAVAFGSNLGDRAGHIDAALRLLNAHEHISLVDTSFLYETAPMYLLDQPRFLNGACKLATTLSAHELLAVLQSVEAQVGRRREGVPRNGPRVVDLDLLFYDDAQIQDGEHLVVPHPRIAERGFVLLPLNDILPTLEHPVHQRTVAQLLDTLKRSPQYDGGALVRTTPLPSGAWRWRERTLVMGILNATPDSVSDGGELGALPAAAAHAERLARLGADVLDIGGASTAPGAAPVSAEEEIRRVVPLVAELRRRETTAQVPISVDTSRAEVAAAALDAGATLVNDVSGGAADPGMLPLLAQRGCPVVLMHMRGDPQTMTRLTDYGTDVVGTIAQELAARVDAALRAGVRRWNMVLDPGIGFAKGLRENVQLLQQLPRLTAAPALAPHAALCGLPLLLGPSRKRFLGRLIREEERNARERDEGAPSAEPDAKRRLYATLAVCAASIQTGCVDMVRVHDVAETLDAVRAADALVRVPRPGA